MNQANIYVNYGCGNTAPKEWLNYDYSISVYIRNIPVVGEVLKYGLKTTFAKNVLYGNIVKGLPLKVESCNGVFSSHTLEHLTLDDFRKALINTYKLLKVGGIFRCVIPDLEIIARTYIEELQTGNDKASIDFIKSTLLGIESMPKGLKKHFFLAYYPGMSRHLWMWDKFSLVHELKKVGFIDIRECKFNDCEDKMFNLVENEDRFKNSIAIQCKK